MAIHNDRKNPRSQRRDLGHPAPGFEVLGAHQFQPPDLSPFIPQTQIKVASPDYLTQTDDSHSPLAACAGSRAAERIFTICSAIGPDATTPSMALTLPEARTIFDALSVRM